MEISDVLHPDNPEHLYARDRTSYNCGSAKEAKLVAESLKRLNWVPHTYTQMHWAVAVYRDAFQRAQLDKDKRIVEIIDYKKRVAAVAMKYAVTYGWCDQVRYAMKELDIKLEEPQVTGIVTVSYPFTAKVPFDHLVSLQAGAEHFVLQWLEIPSLNVKPNEVFIIPGGMVHPTDVRLMDLETKHTTAAANAVDDTEGLPF